MPSSLHAQITRNAISPRLAIRIFLNIGLKVALASRRPSWERLAPGRCVQKLARDAKRRAQSAPTSIPVSLLRPYNEQFLPVLNRLAGDRQLFDDLAGNVRFNLVEQFH